MRPLRVGLLLLAVLFPSLWAAGSAVAVAPPTTTVATVPSANQVLTSAPNRIEVITASAATGGTARVLDSKGQSVASGALNPIGPGTLALDLPALGTGVYSVSWTVAADSGAFAFDVSGGSTSPAAVTTPKPATALGPMEDNLVTWVPLIAIMIFVGTLALRFLVSAPAARRAGRPELQVATDRRLTRIAAVAITVFVPTTLAEQAYSDGHFDFGSIWPSLGADISGHYVGGRLAVTALAALFVIPMALRRGKPSVPLLAAGLVCGLAELTGRELPSALQPNVPRTLFNTVLYVAHLFGAAIWIGGLVALLGLALRSPVPAEDRRAFWPTAIRRFSTAAMTAVGALVLSGLWLYWVHIDGVNQLVSTLYGRTLLVKLCFVAALVLLGAANQFWLMPKIDGQHATADHGGLRNTLVRHFRLTIAVEVLLGLIVLFIAPLLGGSARNQAFQASPDVLAQTARAGSTEVKLVPSGLQPGLVDYLVKVPGGDPAPKDVEVSFASSKLGIPAQTVSATALGNGTYRVSGYYTPVVGKWQVGVSLDNSPPATFTLAVADKAPKLPKSAAPKVRWTTWLAGIGETVLVVLAMVSSVQVSRRLTARQTQNRPPAPEPEADRDLVDA